MSGSCKSNQSYDEIFTALNKMDEISRKNE